MFEKPILFYSKYCQHSAKFLRELNRSQELFDHVVKIDIDVNPQTRKRHPLYYELPKQIGKRISEVPTLIVDNYFLVGTDVNKWLYNILDKINTSGSGDSIDINNMGFNPNEMGSFSDGYAELQSNNMISEKRQSFYFLNDNHAPIQTIDEGDFQGVENKLNEREQFDNIIRQNRQPMTPSKSEMNLSAKIKKDNLDNLFEQKLAERQRLEAPPPPR